MFADYLGSLRVPAGARRGSGTTGHGSGTGDRAPGFHSHIDTKSLGRTRSGTTGHESAARCSCNGSRTTGQLAGIRARGPRPGLEKNRPERALTGSTCCGPTAAGRARCDTKRSGKQSRRSRNKKAPRRALVWAAARRSGVRPCRGPGGET
jgi:hypothetical protein